MSFNITGFDPNIFYAINSTLHIILFLVFHLPTFILNILCVVALVLAKALNWQIRATLANILTAEIVISIGISFFYVGYPIRVSSGDDFNYSCTIGLGIVILGFLANTTAVSLYAITVYIFMKYGPSKLKWYIMAAFATGPWIVFTVIGILLAVQTSSSTVSHGFCVYEEEQEPLREKQKYILFAIVGTVLLFSLCLVLIFGVLTCLHVRKHVTEGNTSNKKAISKILLYHLVKMSILLAQFMTNAVLNVSLQPARTRNGVILFLVIEYVLVNATFDITSLLTPILSLIILQPLRDMLKLMLKRMCCCFKQSVVHHLPENTVVTEISP